MSKAQINTILLIYIITTLGGIISFLIALPSLIKKERDSKKKRR